LTGLPVQYAPSPVIAYREVAYNNSTLIAVPTTPTPCTLTNCLGTDPAFSLANGTITFNHDVAWCSTVSVLAACNSGTPVYYTDAEISLDGGATWTRGSNSMRMEQLAAGYLRTREFSFAGKFPAGSMLRFVEWASAAGVTLVTATDHGSTAPARRLTYLRIPAVVV